MKTCPICLGSGALYHLAQDANVMCGGCGGRGMIEVFNTKENDLPQQVSQSYGTKQVHEGAEKHDVLVGIGMTVLISMLIGFAVGIAMGGCK